MSHNILTISGSLRAGSFNSMLVAEAARQFDGAAVTVADLNLPLYDGDVEAKGLPEAVQKLVAQIQAADAVLISTPEYNKGISGVLKNALDWVSRDKNGALVNKPLGVMSAAAGRTGGETAQFQLRHCLAPFQVRLANAPAVCVAAAHTEFDENGRLKNEQYLAALGVLAQRVKDLI